jgi:hypothetical protein
MNYARAIGIAGPSQVPHDAVPHHHVAKLQGHSLLIDLKAVKPTATADQRMEFILNDLAATDVKEVYVVPTTQLMRVGFWSAPPCEAALEKLRAGVPWAAAGGRLVTGWAIQDLLTKIRITAVPADLHLSFLTTHLAKFGQVISITRNMLKMIPNATDGSVTVTMKLEAGKVLPQFIYLIDSNNVLCDQLMLYTDQHKRHCYRCGLPSHIGLHCKAAGRAKNAPVGLWSVLELPEGVDPSTGLRQPSDGQLHGGQPDVSQLPRSYPVDDHPTGGQVSSGHAKIGQQAIPAKTGQAAKVNGPVRQKDGPLSLPRTQDEPGKMEVVPVELAALGGRPQVDAVDERREEVPVEQAAHGGQLQVDAVDERREEVPVEQAAPGGQLQVDAVENEDGPVERPEGQLQDWPNLASQQFRGEAKKRSLSCSPPSSPSFTPLPGDTSFRSPKNKSRRSRSNRKKGGGQAVDPAKLSPAKPYSKEQFLKASKPLLQPSLSSFSDASRFDVLSDQHDDGQ